MGKQWLVIVLCVAFAANAQQSSDLTTASATIRLKNGRTIHADSTTDAGDKLEYTVGESSYRIPKALIESVVQDQPAAAPASSPTSRQDSKTSANTASPPPAGKPTTGNPYARYLYESTDQLRQECQAGEFVNRLHPEMQSAYQNKNESDRICKILSPDLGYDYEALVNRAVELQRTLCAFPLDRIAQSYKDPEVQNAQQDVLAAYRQFLKRLKDFREHPQPDTPYGQRLQLDHTRLYGACFDGKR